MEAAAAYGSNVPTMTPLLHLRAYQKIPCTDLKRMPIPVHAELGFETDIHSAQYFRTTWLLCPLLLLLLRRLIQYHGPG